MRILFLAGRELWYPRNDVLVRSLRKFAHVDTVAPRFRPSSLIKSSLEVTVQTLPLLKKKYNFVVVGFYGYIILMFIRKLFRGKIIFDPFISNYDTFCFDRRVFNPRSILGRTLMEFDKLAYDYSDHLLIDTYNHASFFKNTFFLNESNISVLPVGCNQDIFRYTPLPAWNVRKRVQVFFACTFLPLHGVDIVIRAASRLRNYPIHFSIVGRGPQYDSAIRLYRHLNIDNISFFPIVPLPKLAYLMSCSHICLGGHFSHIPKATRVIPTKVYQSLAVGRPVIASDHPGNRELLQDRKNAFLISPDNPDDLANAIVQFSEDYHLAYRIAREGFYTFSKQCSEDIIHYKLRKIFNKLIH